MENFKDSVIESDTPYNSPLCAKYERSFAYYTVNIRLPVILTKVVDSLVREKDAIIEQYGQESQEELKEIIGLFSKLKNELQTNKPFIPFKSCAPDIGVWNTFLEEQTRIEGEPRWYSTVWLYAECYMYRRFREAFELSNTLNTYDYFRQQKEAAMLNAMSAAGLLGDYILSLFTNRDIMGEKQVKKELCQLLKVDLWSNTCDLSISLGEGTVTKNYLEKIKELSKFVLVDDSEKICAAIHGVSKNSAGIAFICDNTGYEIFSDMCLADFLITFSLADKITFHLKAVPWYISDVMPHDFQWTIDTLSKCTGSLQSLGTRWQNYLDSGRWSVEASYFWTLPYDYNCMQDLDPELYSSLAREKLLIFKGDLNYRKLLREINWRPTKIFHDALGNFHPTNIATLRTVKCDLICGLAKDQAEVCTEQDPEWMRKGQYGVIQFDGVPFDKLSGCSVAAYFMKA